MATTEFTTASAERVQLWSKKLWLEMPRQIFWGKLMKENDDNAPIEVRRDLEANPGDKLTFTLSNKLTGDGVSGDTVLEGQEEQLPFYSDDVTVDQRRNAVRLQGQMSEKRTAFDQRTPAKSHLRTWLAEKIDDDIFTKMTTSPTTSVFGGNVASVATLTTAGVITTALMDRCVAKAHKALPKIWPVKIGGDEHWVLVIHTDVAFDLQQDTTWNTTQRDAGVRGMENLIFQGKHGTWRGIVLHAHEKVPVASDGGSGGDVPYASNIFMGRQAGLFVWGRRPSAAEKLFDYDNSIGFAIGAIWGVTKATFQAQDHASIALITARTNV